MTPVEKAAAVYEREPCARTFKEDLEAHLLHGYVFSTPEFFLMGRPVIRGAIYSLIVNPWHVFDDPDCWHVYLFAGDLSKVYAAIPYPLPFISFERKNKLRVFPVEQIRKKMN